MSIETRFFALQGGLDLVTPAIRIPAGRAIAAVNYEPHPRGYQRVSGFERFDGRAKPSEASYWLLRFKNASAAVDEGDLVQGATSNATGQALIDAVVESGSYGDGDAAGYLVLMAVTGTFQDGEDLEVASTKVAEADGDAGERGALNDQDDNAWLQDAIAKTRALIAEVPGSGPVRGVKAYDGDVYAFRDNAGGTACVLHKATAAGWTAQALGRELPFTAGGLRELAFTAGGALELAFTSGGTYEISAGDTITGGSSGATATVRRVVLASGTWAGGDAAGTLILDAPQTGTFVAENLDVGANLGVASIAGDSTAIAIQANDVVEGADSGAKATVKQVILSTGTWAGGDAAGRLVIVDQNAISFRAERLDVDGGETDLASASGDSVTIAIVQGATITGETSAATAVVTRVVFEGGSWSTHDARGRLIFASQSGTFAAETIRTGDQQALATIGGNSTAIALPPGGSYNLVNYNFYGAANLTRMYGANGVGRAFEWDGTVFVPLSTGMADDRPTYLAAHRNHLFLAFPGGSLQHSSIADPYQWQILTGAGEIGIGEEITGLLADTAGVLSVFGRNKVALLYGSSSADWELRWLSSDAGAIAGTVQKVGAPIYLDDRGIRSMETTERFGDFQIGTMTQMVEPLFQVQRRAGVLPVASLRVRARDQYRLYWSDGTGLTLYFGRQPAEAMPFNLGTTLSCTDADDESDALYAGAEDGFVYQLDAGTSFDGGEVEAFIRLPFNHVGSPSQRKRWTKATLEVDGGPSTRLGLVAEFGYGDPDQPPGEELPFSVKGSGGLWNEARWENFFWSSAVEGLAEAPIDGLGRNMSIAVVSDATHEQPHVLHGLILHFTYRGIVR